MARVRQRPSQKRRVGCSVSMRRLDSGSRKSTRSGAAGGLADGGRAQVKSVGPAGRMARWGCANGPLALALTLRGCLDRSRTDRVPRQAPGAAYSGKVRHCPGLEVSLRPVKDRDRTLFRVKAAWVQQAVRSLWMTVEPARPSLRAHVVAAGSELTRGAERCEMATAQVHELEWSTCANTGEMPLTQGHPPRANAVRLPVRMSQ